MERIILVDDSQNISSLMIAYLEQNGFEVEHLNSTSLNRTFYFEDFDLMLLASTLPVTATRSILSTARAGSIIPILVIASKDNGLEPIAALELGADDCMVLELDPKELTARIRALLRRSRLPSRQTKSKQLPNEHLPELELCEFSRTSTLRGRPLYLTRREIQLLKSLCSNPQKTFSREELSNIVWGSDAKHGSRRVDLYVSRIRAKAQTISRMEIIESIYGVGYRLHSDMVPNAENPDCSLTA